jgi:hypothetical protein
MKVVVITRDTGYEVGQSPLPITFDDAGVEIDRGILLVRDFKNDRVTEYNGNYWQSVTYGDKP